MEENRVTLNTMLPAYSQISKMKIYPEEFEKTPKKSIKRYFIRSKRLIDCQLHRERYNLNRKRERNEDKENNTYGSYTNGCVSLPAQNKSAGINISIWKDICTQPHDSTQTTYINIGLLSTMNRLNGVGINALGKRGSW